MFYAGHLRLGLMPTVQVRALAGATASVEGRSTANYTHLVADDY